METVQVDVYVMNDTTMLIIALLTTQILLLPWTRILHLVHLYDVDSHQKITVNTFLRLRTAAVHNFQETIHIYATGIVMFLDDPPSY